MVMGITSSWVPWRMVMRVGPRAMSSSSRAVLSKRWVTRKPSGTPMSSRLMSMVLVKGETMTPLWMWKSDAAMRHAAAPRLWPKMRRRDGSEGGRPTF